MGIVEGDLAKLALFLELAEFGLGLVERGFGTGSVEGEAIEGGRVIAIGKAVGASRM